MNQKKEKTSQTKVGFGSEDLKVDWIGFTIESPLESANLQKLGEYFLNHFHCRILITEGNDYQKVESCYQSDSNFQFTIYLTPCRKIYWDGVIVIVDKLSNRKDFFPVFRFFDKP